MYYQLCINSYYLTDSDKLIHSETYQNVPAKVGLVYSIRRQVFPVN